MMSEKKDYNQKKNYNKTGLSTDKKTQTFLLEL